MLRADEAEPFLRPDNCCAFEHHVVAARQAPHGDLDMHVRILQRAPRITTVHSVQRTPLGVCLCMCRRHRSNQESKFMRDAVRRFDVIGVIPMGR